MRSPRTLEGWIGRATYVDAYGHIRRPRHRPDLGTYVGATRRPVAVEVGLQRKSGARLRGILMMYATRTDERDGVLAGVVYIVGPNYVTKALRTTAGGGWSS